MRWEERLLALFDDLEQQAEGLALTARDADVAELGRAEYAALGLGDRLHGSVGRHLDLTITGVGRLRAELLRAGPDVVLVRQDDGDRGRVWLVRLAALARVAGLGERARDERHRSLGSRLGFGSALRRVAEDGSGSGAGVLVRLLDGTTARGRVLRVGADFVEILEDADSGALVLPLRAVAAVRLV